MESANGSLVNSSSTASTPEEPPPPARVTRRTSPFMQYFHIGRCKLCGREFRGLKASNGKRHLEMKHPKEYQQVLEHKRRIAGMHKGRKSMSTICSSTDDDEFQQFATTSFSLDASSFSFPLNEDDEEQDQLEHDDPIDAFDNSNPASKTFNNGNIFNSDTSTFNNSGSTPFNFSSNLNSDASNNYPSNSTAFDQLNEDDLDKQLTECVSALARPFRRLALFAGTTGVSASQLVENKHLKELLAGTSSQMLMPAASELEQQINLEISDVLLRIHRRLNSLPHGFCVSADLAHSGTGQSSMGIVAHFWSKELNRPATAALDIVHLNGEDVGLEFVAETLKHAFDKTDLNATRIYRTIVESSGKIGRKQRLSQGYSTSELKIDGHNYSLFHVGSCAAYRLRLTLDNVFTIDQEHVRVQKKLSALLDKLAESKDVFNAWQAQLGSLQFPQNLNWSSWRNLYELVAEQTTLVNQFLHDQKLPQLSRSDLQTIGNFMRLERPILEFAQRLEARNNPTCSLLFPGVKHLLQELKTMSASSRLAHLLSTALSSRFVDVLTSIDEQADPFYLAAAFLDPTVAFTVKKYEQLAHKAIKTICARILSNQQRFNASNSTSFPVAQGMEGVLDELDKEIKEYLSSFIHSPWTQGSGFDFWRQRHQKFPNLSPMALSILVVPATSREARRLLDGLDVTDGNGRELWKRALLIYNDSYICV